MIALGVDKGKIYTIINSFKLYFEVSKKRNVYQCAPSLDPFINGSHYGTRLRHVHNP